jgi:FkbM family methyltransferase
MNRYSGIRAVLRAFGIDVIRYRKAGSAANARRLRVIADCRIDVVLDVGASEGNFGEKLRASGYSGRILSFEPLSASYNRLREVSDGDDAWKVVHTAIGNVDGKAPINVSGRHTSSSLLPMAATHAAAAPDSGYVSQEIVPIARLDNALMGLITPVERLYLKIDVQGYEASVLAGATATLLNAHAVEVELSTVALYEGSVLYAQMIATMDSLGFKLVSWEDVFTDPQTGYVLQADCIFARLP